MNSLRVVFFAVLLHCCALTYAHKACQIEREYLGLAYDAKACKTKCRRSSLDCIAWGYSEFRERCTGYIMKRDEKHTVEGSSSFASFGSSTNFYNCETVASPNVTTPATSFGTDCEFSLVFLSFQPNEQGCTSACQDLKSNVYGGCAGWMWARVNQRCIGLLVKSGYNYDSCGAP
eukprot:g2250.t1